MPRLRLLLGMFLAASGWAAAKAQSVPLTLRDATLDVDFEGGITPPVEAAALRWTRSAAEAVATYYGQFPVRRVHIVIRTGGRPGAGQTSGEGGAHITVGIGRTLDDGRVDVRGDDWIMTHEMVHLALPGVEPEHHWLEEGLATYVEPIARVRAGELREQQVWSDMMDGLPQGQPEAGDRGLDRTPTWGRTYWGGALFCFLADVKFREATHNRAGLETALRGILRAGGNIEHDWPLTQVLDVGDGAVGAPVLRSLYQRMRYDSSPVDLAGLWRRLGVQRVGEHVLFDDTAPDAAIRQAIMAPAAPSVVQPDGEGR